MKKIIITTILLMFSQFVYANDQPKHIIIIDTGSTGTRAHIFEYQPMGPDQKKLTGVKEIAQFRQEPGVTAFVDKAAGLQTYMTNLINKTNQTLTAEQRKNTPIYLFATAGMRNAPKAEQLKLMSSLRSTISAAIKTDGYQEPENINKHVTMIAGNAEALFGWLSVNYLMHKVSVDSLEARNTFGVVDMGGASTQITFLPKAIPLRHYQGFLFNKTLYLLYSYSYGTYGLEQAKKMTKAQYTKSINACYPQTGEGNFNQCLTLLQNFVYKPNQFKVCENKYGEGNCSKMGIYQPSITDTQFIGIDKYFHYLKVLGLADNIASLGQLHDNAINYCKTTWSDIKKQHPKQDDATLNNVCFASAWYYTILKGYHMQDDTPFIVTNHITAQSSDWALGAAIYLLTQPELPEPFYYRR